MDKRIFFFMKTDLVLKSDYDGLELSAVVVRPEEKPEAVLQIAHGLCGCKERYLGFMEYMAGHGVACVACDHRGHGQSVKSAEDLGYIYEGGYAALVEDMKLVTDWAAGAFPDVPVFLLGHSMGSMAARIYAKKYDWELSGMILCGSPARVGYARVAMLVTGLLSMFKEGRLRPAFIQDYANSRYNRNFEAEGKSAWLCSDPDVCEKMLNNPLTNYHMTANLMHNVLAMMVQTYSKRGWRVLNPDMPVTFLSGADDACMGGEQGLHKAAVLMYNLGYHNVTSALFTGMRHEILNEVDKQLVWDDILSFIRNISSK